MKTTFKSALSNLFLATILFVLLSTFTFSTKTTEEDPAPVVLSGTLNTGGLRSSQQDFIVTVSANYIDISYCKNYANITIEIMDASGQTVYSEKVNPVAGESMTIDISGWAVGSYHISFTNTSGGCVYGDFEVGH